MRKWMVAVWMMIAGTCFAQQVDLKSLDKFAALAESKTEINMDESMVKAAASFLDEKDKDEAVAKKSVSQLKGFFLRAYEFNQKGIFKLEDLKPLLRPLERNSAGSRFHPLYKINRRPSPHPAPRQKTTIRFLAMPVTELTCPAGRASVGSPTASVRRSTAPRSHRCR